MTRAKDISKILTDADLSGTLDVTGNLTVDTSTLKVDSANNRVGINTTGSVRDLQIGDNSRSASILSLQTNSSGNGSIYFGDNTTTNAEYGGMIRYSHSDNAMLFWTSSTERMRITSIGNVGIGNSSPVAKLDVNSGDIAISSTQTSDNGDLGELQFWNTTNAGSGSGTSFVNDVASIQGQMEGTGNNSGGSLHFYTKTDGGSKTQQMTITGDGNVGIGESNPVAKTHIQGSGTSGQTTASLILENSSSGTAGMDITGSAGSSRLRFLYGGGPSTGTNALTEAMNIVLEGSNAGKVGIGTSSPNAKLDIKDDSNSVQAILRGRSSDNFGILDFRNNAGDTVKGQIKSDASNRLIFRSGPSTDVMYLFSSGNVGIGNSNPSAKLDVTGAIEADDKITIAYEAGSSDWELESTSGDDFTISRNGSEKLRIDGSNGEVGIGTTSPNAQLEVSSPNLASTRDALRLKNQVTNTGGYFIRFENSTGGVAGYVEQTGQSAVSYGTSSDYRLKENVVDLNDATTRLKQLQPKRFNFITEPNTTLDGFLAHEVQSVVPEAVSGTKDAVDEQGNIKPQGIDQSKLVPLLVKTIQELEARIVALETA